MPDETWFDPEDGRSAEERSFLGALDQRAKRWRAVGLEPDDAMVFHMSSAYLIVGLDVVDRERGCAVRTLRVDVYSERVVCGDDLTHQFVGDLVPERAAMVTAMPAGASPDYLAAVAADWIEGEIRRPIVRLEWIRSSFWHRRWVMEDTAKVLCVADSENSTGRDLGAPDRVIRVTPFGECR